MSTSKKHSELEAVQVVHKALEPFDPVARARVLRAVASLLEITSFPTGDNKPPPGGGSSNDRTDTGTPQQMKIDAFITSKHPKNTYQRLACLAYYLEHHDQKTNISGKDLTKANSDARQLKISNMAVFLNDATNKYGFFAPVGKGKKQLTSRGTVVVEALPDQAAVKQALLDNPMPKKSGRRAKPKRDK
jgi:hypothetical protein